MIRRVASVLIVGGLLQTGAFGQTAPPLIARPETPPAPAPTSDTPKTPPLPQGYREPIPTDPAHPNYHAGAHRSIIRHNPLPRRTSYQSNYSNSNGGYGSSSGNNQGGAGYSTGGVGRVAEYYDDQTLATPIDYHAAPVGRFDSGGGPNRSEQIQAQQAGTQRANNIQTNINAYGTPYGAMGAGFGYGLGLGGGRLYTYPY